MSIWQGERDNLVGGTMVRPEMFAIEGKRPTRERHDGDIFDFRCFQSRIEARDSPTLAVLFRPTQDVDQAIDEGMTADLRADIDDAENVSTRTELENAMLVPLTQIKLLAV